MREHGATVQFHRLTVANTDDPKEGEDDARQQRRDGKRDGLGHPPRDHEHQQRQRHLHAESQTGGICCRHLGFRFAPEGLWRRPEENEEKQQRSGEEADPRTRALERGLPLRNPPFCAHARHCRETPRSLSKHQARVNALGIAVRASRHRPVGLRAHPRSGRAAAAARAPAPIRHGRTSPIPIARRA